MSSIGKYISEKAERNEKVLSIFLTSGFPDKNIFPGLAAKVLDAGADILEIGFPFSDPLADGISIQNSSKSAIENGINLERTFEYVYRIKEKTMKPVILMGYANPVLKYGISNFFLSCRHSGVDGVIIPDIPLEELDGFYPGNFNDIDKILLITPTTSDERIKLIDSKSSGFVYCVSVSGTTGVRNSNGNIQYIKNSRNLLNKNKMLVGFGISDGKSAKIYSEFSDGVIAGSAIINSLVKDKSDYKNTLALVREIKASISNIG